MGWYALYKWFKPFRLKGYCHWIYWYRESIKTPEQKEKEKRIIEQRLKRANEALAFMIAFNARYNSFR